MSYILDALRKADAERERGHVPGINAQPTFAGHARAGAAPATRPWVWLAIGVLGVLGVAAALWYGLGRDASRGGVATVPAAPAPIVAAPVIQPNAPPLATTAPITAPTPPPAFTPAPVAATPAVIAPPPVVARRPPEAPTAARKPAPSPSADAGVSAVPVPAAGASATGTRIYAQSELPDDIRRQLPNVAVGGSAYSTRPADRILIINGQVLHEGDQIAPELLLQQIRLKGALLSFKGYRYTIAF